MAFTNYIQQITATNGTTHDLVDTSASHYVKGTQTSSTYAWTGALPDGVTAYYDGLTIDYFLPYAGTSTAATLNLGSKGAKPVYLGNSNSAVTTHFPQYSVIHLVYIINSGLNSGNGCWKASSYYDTNTTYTIPTKASSATTGISASTTATKTSLGTAFTIPNVTSAGSASTWAFEEVSIPNVTAAGSASTWTFEEKSIPNVTSAGSASTWTFEEKSIPNVTSAGSASSWTFSGVTVANSISGAVDSSDSTQLNITLGTTTVQSKSGGGNGTAPTLGTAIKVQSKSGGGNGSAPTLGTAIKVQSKSGGGNGSAPTLGTSIKVQSKKSGANGSAPTLGTAFTVPNVTGNTSATVSITDSGHTHNLS